MLKYLECASPVEDVLKHATSRRQETLKPFHGMENPQMIAYLVESVWNSVLKKQSPLKGEAYMWI